MSLVIAMPRSHAARILNLKQTLNTANSETEKPFLTGITPELSQLIPQYEMALFALQESSINVNQVRDALNARLERLKLVVRAGWQGLRLRQSVENQSAQVFDIVGLHRRLNPTPRQRQGWVDWGNKLLAGEEALVAKGYPPMTNPAMSTVAEALEGAQASIIFLDQELVKMKERRKVLNQVGERGHLLLRKVCMSLRQTLIEEKVSVRRDVMRRFGFSFNERSTAETDTREPHIDPGSIPTNASLPMGHTPTPPTTDPFRPTEAPDKPSNPKSSATFPSSKNPFRQANQRHIIAGAGEGLVNVDHASACLSGASNGQHKLKHAQRFPVSRKHPGKQTNTTSQRERGKGW